MHPRQTRRLRARQAAALAHPDRPSYNPVPRPGGRLRPRQPRTLREAATDGVWLGLFRCAVAGAVFALAIVAGWVTLDGGAAEADPHRAPWRDDVPADVCQHPDDLPSGVTCPTILPGRDR